METDSASLNRPCGGEGWFIKMAEGIFVEE
jgi:hypothetical protein